MKKTLLTLLVLLCIGKVQSTLGQCTTITQPDTALLCPSVGAMTTVSVAADITTATYTWQYRVITPNNPNPLWKTITAANAGAVYTDYTTANLGVTRATAILPTKGTQYRAIISGGNCGAVTSNAANLVILDDVKAGKIVSAPSVCTGSDITLQVSDYIGSSFQWESSSSSTGMFTPITGETNEMFTLTAANSSSNRYYRVVVTNDACNTAATTNVKTVKIDPLSIGGTIIGGGTMCADNYTTLRLTGYKGTIQWEYSKDGVDFDKAPIAQDNSPASAYQTTSVSNTQTTYVVGSLKAPTYFRAKVTSGFCSKAFSNVVTCVLGDTAQTTGISPVSSTICRGTGLTLTVNANGAMTWEKSTNFTSSNPTWIVTTNHTNTFNTGNLNLPTAYRVKVSVGACSELATIYTDMAIITILPQAIAKPATANATVPSGKTIATPLCISDTSKVLTLAAGFSGDIQWQASTTSSTSGYIDLADETESAYTVTNPAVGVNYFRAKFTNSCGTSVYNTPITVYYTDCGSGKMATALPNQPLSVTAYPNPYAANFNLNVATSNNDKVIITVFDMTGRQIEMQDSLPNAVAALSFGNQYPAGVYAITVTQGGDTKTLKVVKQ